MHVLGDLVEKQAWLIPDREAVIDPRRERVLTYRDLEIRTRHLANALAARGLKPGDRVATLLSNGYAAAELPFALGRAGMIQVNVNERLRERETEYVLGDSGSSAVITESAFLPLVASAGSRLAGLEHVISVDGGEEAHDYEALIAAGSGAEPSLRPGPSDTAMLIYTSGTTGNPKGVQLTHHNLVHNATNFLIESMHDPNGTYLACMPYFHVVCVPHMAALMRGMRVVARPFELEPVLALIERYRVTVAFFVPTMIALILQNEELLAKYDLSSLETVLYAAAPIPVPVLRRALRRFGPIFCQMYGLSESAALSTILRKEEHVVDGTPEWTARLASCGREVTHVQVRVLLSSGDEAAPGELGEIVIRGDNVMAGYWDRPDATRQALEGGWLHTGDIGRRDADGYLYVVDRKNDMIITGGFNVYPREVEDVLHEHPAIAEAAVIGIPDQTWGETLLAIVATRPGQTVTADGVIAHCAAMLADYKKPREVRFVDALPRTGVGKIDKRSLRAEYRKGEEAQVV